MPESNGEAMPRKTEEREPVQPSANTPRQPTRGDRMLTPKETANFLRLSESWLAKARMRGDGPPYAKFGGVIRYSEIGLVGYAKSRLRLSTASS
jgi:hypothetical protein